MNTVNDISKPSLDELAHYGIKGMKWGVRRSDAQLARARGRVGDAIKKSAKQQVDFYKKPAVRNTLVVAGAIAAAVALSSTGHVEMVPNIVGTAGKLVVTTREGKTSTYGSEAIKPFEDSGVFGTKVSDIP
ncbi:MAG: hypothetical protein LC687_00970, partial [Actinobacteria bacterium]|nr:hypothetical protein [Actinomycetota bacterium]